MVAAERHGAQSGRFFRLNCRPEEVSAVDRMLQAEGFVCSRVPLFNDARILEHGPRPLGSSLAAFFGLLYIQDRSSLLPPLCLDPGPGDRILDMCASPGSKTGLLSQLVGPSGGVLANEPNRSRLQTLRKNLQILNLVNVVSTRFPGQDFPQTGDQPLHILCDVPCSGWGTVDRHPRVKSLWTDDRIGPLIDLQRKILGRAAELLQPGARMVYSTCTTNVRENEDQVLWARDSFGLDIQPLPLPEGIVGEPLQRAEAEGCFRVDGPRSGGQSFFLGCVTRPGPQPGRPENPACQERFSLEAGLGPGLENHASTLASSPACWGNLPAGRLDMVREQVVFVPEGLGALLGPTLEGSGFPLGRLKKGRFFLSQRARLLLPRPGDQKELNLEDITQLHRLVQGQSLQVASRARLLPLYWRDLPLGWLSVKGTRGLWTDRG